MGRYNFRDINKYILRSSICIITMFLISVAIWKYEITANDRLFYLLGVVFIIVAYQYVFSLFKLSKENAKNSLISLGVFIIFSFVVFYNKPPEGNDVLTWITSLIFCIIYTVIFLQEK